MTHMRQTGIDNKWVLRKKDSVAFVVTKLIDCNYGLLDGLLTVDTRPQKDVDLSHTVTKKDSIDLPSIDYKVRQGYISNVRCLQQTDLPPFSSTLWSKSHGVDCPFGTNEYSTGNQCTNSRINSVFEVCVEVKDVARALQQARECGAVVIRPLTIASSKDGDVPYAIIQSCVGNVQHTIINTNNYSGTFLPTFEEYSESTIYGDEECFDVSFDHITFCVPPDQTLKVITWYEKCFSMQRFIMNREESYSDGLMLGDIGMRLAAMSYWMCAESGISLDSSTTSITFVIAESLSDAPNQVTTFLQQHGGPGIQHVGLATDQLIDAVRLLKQRQVPFLQPPREYYQEIGKLREITECGESVELLEDCGILLDSEACCGLDADEENTDENSMSAYLMQIFTKPLFGDDTFFLELLQRHGAHGFGAGNITALWKAVALFMKKKELD
ncbi:4-hydroxyphenylpyruvate dioxygenase-like protein [Watersipora subatra]|uniref:4-hydroxyphenylpyruvate dioxygenase-like protein n=1 Tax=Watersipora subatra TaxID=2589382 RepID=UPI00355BBBDF